MPPEKKGRTMNELAINTDEAMFEGGNFVEAQLQTEAYEGKVALHMRKREDEDDYPAVSIYVPIVDAVVFAERILASARQAVDNPTYVP
jgi:hypothetical protein